MYQEERAAAEAVQQMAQRLLDTLTGNDIYLIRDLAANLCQKLLSYPPGQITDVEELSSFTHDYYRIVESSSSSYNDNLKVGDAKTADVIASAISGTGDHTVMLDLDVPAKLIPSATPGHYHLYIDVVMGWKHYKFLLAALAACGIIEDGYKKASIARGFSALRPPWRKKQLKSQ